MNTARYQVMAIPLLCAPFHDLFSWVLEWHDRHVAQAQEAPDRGGDGGRTWAVAAGGPGPAAVRPGRTQISGHPWPSKLKMSLANLAAAMCSPDYG
jgi:hypothetical protein